MRDQVVAIFDVSCDVGATALAAARMARELHVELSGVFVEEQRALHMAALPFTVLVESSGRSSPVGAETIEAFFRVAEGRARAELSRVAASHDVPSSFRVMRGHLAGAVQQFASARGVVLGSEPPARPRREGGARVLCVAADPTRLESLRGLLRRLGAHELDELRLPSGAERVATVDAIAARAAAQGVRLVATSLGEPWVDAGALEQLRRRTPVPVILLAGS